LVNTGSCRGKRCINGTGGVKRIQVDKVTARIASIADEVEEREGKVAGVD